MKQIPEITVLMPVKNGAKYIEEAIDSVLRQSFTDFELLIMDDGSIDNTVERVQKYTDPRIRLEKCEAGFIENLNRGLILARARYIARMDADDIMHTERLRIQLKRMKRNPEITVCGTWANLFSDGVKCMVSSQRENGIVENPILKLLKGNMILHPTVMIDKYFLISNGIMYSAYTCVEDYKLWFDITKCGGTLFVEPQELLFYRISDTQVTTLRKGEMKKQSILLRKEILNYLLSLRHNKTLDDLYLNMRKLEEEKMIVSEDIFCFFFAILSRRQSEQKAVCKT